jgi:hypothetical protein
LGVKYHKIPKLWRRIHIFGKGELKHGDQEEGGKESEEARQETAGAHKQTTVKG